MVPAASLGYRFYFHNPIRCGCSLHVGGRAGGRNVAHGELMKNSKRKHLSGLSDPYIVNMHNIKLVDITCNPTQKLV